MARGGRQGWRSGAAGVLGLRGRLGRSSTPAQEHGGGAALGVRNRGRR